MIALFFNDISRKINQGIIPSLCIMGHMILGTALVYMFPRSNLAFLVLITSFFSLYYFEADRRFKFVAGAVLTLLIFPVVGVRNIFYLEVIFQISVFSALALGLNIVVGFAGLLDLGYVAFYAVGAYLWAFFGSQQFYILHYAPGTQPANLPFLMPGDTFYLFVFAAIFVAALTGILLGTPVLRLRGDYLAIVTLGFGEVIRVLANNLDKPLNLTNGPQGITPIQRPTMPEGVLHLFNRIVQPLVGHRVTDNQAYNILFYLIALLVVVTVIVITYRLDDSKVGRAWTAIREDELSAGAMGINANKLKLGAFAVGASFAGAMGVLFAASRTFVSPETFTFLQSVGVLTMVILGGIGSITGVVVGATVVTLLNIQVLQSFSLYLSQLRQSDAVLLGFHWKNLSNQLDPTKYQRLIFGIVLVIMMIYRPAGLLPAARRKRELGGAPEGKDLDEKGV